MGEKTCPKCKGKMEPGKMSDSVHSTDRDIRGLFNKKYRGLYWFADEGISTLMGSRSDRISLVGYICIKCGFVEIYGELEK